MARKIKVVREDRVDGSINQFIIECLFQKYFEEEKEIACLPARQASAAPQGRPRNDSEPVLRNDEVYGFPLSRE